MTGNLPRSRPAIEAGRAARGRLRFERANGATAVCAAYAESPLRLLTPRNHGSAAWVYTSTLGGGLVDGDRLALDVELRPGTRAFLSTQGPTRVYRSPRGCEIDVCARVGADAALVLAPDPTSCFGGARYRQRTEIDLDARGSLLLFETLTSGRSARGERWAFSRCLVSLAVRCGGAALVDESMLLDPGHGPLAERLGRFEAFATLLVAGPLFDGLRGRVRKRIEGTPLARGAPLVAAASPLGGDALLARFAAESVEELARAVRSHLDGLPALLGDDPWARRC